MWKFKKMSKYLTTGSKSFKSEMVDMVFSNLAHFRCKILIVNFFMFYAMSLIYV